MELNRRGFLKSAIGTGLFILTPNHLLAGLRSQKPILQLHKISSSPVTIAAIDLIRLGDKHYVRTTASNGAMGITSVNGRLLNTLTMFKNIIVPYFKGKDARDLESLVDGVYTYGSNYKYAGLPFWNAVGHVEISLFDMMGKMCNKPVHELLGMQVRSRIPVYLSRLTRETTPEQEVQEVSQALAKTGCNAVKLKIGGRMHNNAHFAQRTNRMIPLARKELGDGVTIYVDSNDSYTAKEAIEVGRMLERHNVGFFEEPCGWQEYEQTKRVADGLKITVAGGEQDSSLPQFAWMIRHRVVDLIQPDLYYNGGFIRSLAVAQMADKAQMKITPHSPKSGADAAAMLHFASVLTNLGPHQEYRVSDDIDGGYVSVPTGSGLTQDVDQKSVREAKPVTQT